MADDFGLPNYICGGCLTHSDLWQTTCPNCGLCGGLNPPRRDGSHVAGHQPTLADARVRRYGLISTGVPSIDRVLGTNWRTKKYGVPVPSLTLLAGGEGCGKTTLMLRVAALCAQPLLYLSTEQTVDALVDTCERIGMTRAELGRIQGEQVTTIEAAIHLMNRRHARLVVLDSISELVDPVHDNGDAYGNTVRMLKRLKEYVEKHRIAMICMVQLNNDNAIAGLRKLRHLVDIVATFEAHGELRLLQCPSKNRYAPTGVKAWFQMTEQGLVPCDAPAETAPDDGPDDPPVADATTREALPPRPGRAPRSRRPRPGDAPLNI